MQQKRLSVLLSTIIVLVLASIGFLYINNSNPTPKLVNQQIAVNPTPSWNSYTNTEYKYTVNYPNNWNIVVAGEADPKTFPAPYLASPCNYAAGELCSQILIGTGESNPENKLEPDFNINLTGPNPDVVSNTIAAKVDGEEAKGFEFFQSNYMTSYDDQPQKGRLLYVLVTNHNGIKYTFTYEESQKGRGIKTANDWQHKNIFDQVIASFKFSD